MLGKRDCIFSSCTPETCSEVLDTMCKRVVISGWTEIYRVQQSYRGH
uniref:Uncharacterized protein n=1 Tax=Arundo donax TaxID=35708 RepID=A0A0A9BSD1_ARUDO